MCRTLQSERDDIAGRMLASEADVDRLATENRSLAHERERFDLQARSAHNECVTAFLLPFLFV